MKSRRLKFKIFKKHLAANKFGEKFSNDFSRRKYMKSRRLKFKIFKKHLAGKPNLGENFQNFQRSLADENKEFRRVKFFI